MNWKKLLDAIVQVESGGDMTAVGDDGLAVGIYQIHPGIITDVNNIYGGCFTLQDRLDPLISRAICVLYVTWYCRYERLSRLATSQDYALCWHYGPDFFNIEDKDHYWDEVSTYIN